MRKRNLFYVLLLLSCSVCYNAQEITSGETMQEIKVEDYIKPVNRLEKRNGWITNRNSYVNRGIWGYIKGVYSGQNKIYIMLEIKNTTNIPYDLESITFVTKTNRKHNGGEVVANDSAFTPIWQTDISRLGRKTSRKLIFVFDKFTIPESKDLVASIYETEGERTVDVNIKADYIINAKYIQ